VDAVLAILQREFETIMRQVGATSLKQINASQVVSEVRLSRG
jgi:isopentenyl diphosphate isomerase/L-lactate dehydrogenase-like FMN-dependent dehydrogenase